jgi:hypothetical protein
MPAADLLLDYARSIRNQRRANPDVPGPALAPTFQRLREGDSVLDAALHETLSREALGLHDRMRAADER